MYGFTSRGGFQGKQGKLIKAVAEALEARQLLTTTSTNSFDFTSGFTGNGMTLNYAIYDTGRLKMTVGGYNESRTAFYSTPVPVNSFNAHFTTQITNSQGVGGITLTLENASTGVNARGGNGGGLGYSGITNSAAIGFSLQNNNTMLVTGGGNPQTAASTSLTSSGINLASGDMIDVSVSYSGTTLTVAEKDLSTSATASQTYTGVNLASLIGSSSAYIGLTGGNGATTGTLITAGNFSYTDTTAKPAGGVNINWPSNIFADAMKMSDWTTGGVATLLAPANLDANGWPKTDATLAIGWNAGGTYWENMYTGTYTLKFNGIATLSTPNGTITGQSYNSSTNTTTATVNITSIPSLSPASIVFTNTQQNSVAATNTGVTNVSLMMPTAPGSTSSFASTQVFTPGALAEVTNNGFNTVRYMAALGSVRATQVNWSDRTLPSYATQVQMFDHTGAQLSYLGNGLSWEYVVAFANATNTDAWINIDMSVTDAYITNLANLFKYGADASGNPYTSTQTSPVWVPLNKNHKIYLEFSNEVWNTAFPETAQNQANAIADVQAYLAGQTTAAANIGKVIDYDAAGGTYNSGTAKFSNQQILNDRLQAYNAKRVGDLFRAVYGDANMGSLIRPVYEWNYGGDGSGGSGGGIGADGLNFLNNYYNNADVPAGGTNHVATPHPVGYYIWGGGGTFYDQSANATGNDAPVMTNNSFETTGNWAYTGGAAQVANGGMGSLSAPDGTHAAAIPNGGSVHQNTPFTSAGQQIASFSLASSAGAAGTLTLKVGSTTIWTGTTFSSTAFQRIYTAAFTTAVTTSTPITFSYAGTGTVYVDAFDAGPVANESFTDGTSQWTTTGTVSTVAGGTSGNPGAAGTYAATFTAGATLTQSMYFSGGLSAIAFTAAASRISGTSYAKGYYTLKIDGTPVALYGTNGQPEVWIRSNLDGTAGGFGSVYSDAVNLTQGMHTVQLTYTDLDPANPSRGYLDNVEVDSSNSMFNAVYSGGNIKAIFTVQSDARLAALYGLHTANYEGGMTVGMDSQSPLQLATETDSRMTGLEQQLYANYYSLGGELPMYFQTSGPNHGLAAGYYTVNLTGSGGTPKLTGVASALAGTQNAIDSRTQFTAARYNPVLPGTLTVNATLYKRPNSELTTATNRESYTFYTRIDTAGYYDISAAMDSSQATSANLTVDGSLLGTIVTPGTTGTTAATYRVWLSAGLHGVKLLNDSTTANGYVYNMSVLPA